jgi:hypothetical protein
MKQSYTFIIYARQGARRFQGILGEFDLHTIQLLLAGGKTLIEEQVDSTDPIQWYTSVLAEQDIHVKASKQQMYKGKQYIWLEIDSERTPIDEFTTWNELPAEDTESLAWRRVLYPVQPSTGKECLGFACIANGIPLQTKSGAFTMKDILDAILVEKK